MYFQGGFPPHTFEINTFCCFVKRFHQVSTGRRLANLGVFFTKSALPKVSPFAFRELRKAICSPEVDKSICIGERVFTACFITFAKQGAWKSAGEVSILLVVFFQTNIYIYIFIYLLLLFLLLLFISTLYFYI